VRNLSHGQTIAVGVMALFGIPLCLGLVVGGFVGFWAGLVVTVVLIAVIAFIAQRWWETRARQQEKHDKEAK